MKRLIANKMQEVTFVQDYQGNRFVQFEIVIYNWQDKEPIYYVFIKGHPDKPVCNAFEYNVVVDILSNIILYHPDRMLAYRDIVARKKLNFISLKLRNII